MKKLSIFLTMMSRVTFLIEADTELWDLLKVGDEFVIEEAANGKLFVFQTEIIIESTLNQITKRYYEVTKKRLVASEEYFMRIDMTEIRNPAGRR